MQIVIVGGGPVGLFLGIELIKKSHNVTILEKRTEYSRDEIVVIRYDLVQKFPDNVRTQLFGPNRIGCYLSFPNLSRAENFKDFIPVGGRGTEYSQVFCSIPLHELEKQLAKEASRVGVAVKYGINNISCKDNFVYYNDTKLSFDRLIGADGSTSIIRDHIGGKLETLVNSEPRWTILMTGKKRGNFSCHWAMTFDDVMRNYARPTQNHRRVFVTQDGEYYVAFNVSKKFYDDFSQRKKSAVKDFGFRLWDTAASHGIGPSPLPDTPGEYDYRKLKMFSVPDVQACDIVCKENIFLVGDAAMTTHFFTGSGLNNGLDMALFLANEGLYNPKAYEEYYKGIRYRNEQALKTLYAYNPEDHDKWVASLL